MVSAGFAAARANAAELTEVVARVKPSVVAVGTYQANRAPSLVFRGTGFAVEDGRTVITNSHVLPDSLDAANRERLVILAGHSSNPDPRDAVVLARDTVHDLAVLRIQGAAIPALALADSDRAREGQSMAFTGFPLAMALGLNPATHRATLAAIATIAPPQPTDRTLNPAFINRIRSGQFAIFQLDGTAYPGNSGSPLYDSETGSVFGIVNMVFVKGSREAAISSPSGISYAIPAKYIRALLDQATPR